MKTELQIISIPREVLQAAMLRQMRTSSTRAFMEEVARLAKRGELNLLELVVNPEEWHDRVVTPISQES